MFLLGLISGIVIGTIFGATIIKYWGKAKEAGKAVAEDLKKDVNNLQNKP
jgi:Na+/glutamate symporter